MATASLSPLAVELVNINPESEQAYLPGGMYWHAIEPAQCRERGCSYRAHFDIMRIEWVIGHRGATDVQGWDRESLESRRLLDDISDWLPSLRTAVDRLARGCLNGPRIRAQLASEGD